MPAYDAPSLKPFRRFRAALLILPILAAWISACAAPAPPATSTPLPAVTAAETIAPTNTQLPSPTPTTTATATNRPTATPSQTPTVTASPVPEAAWDQLEVTSVTNQAGGISITLLVPNLATAYDLWLAGEKYTCTVDPKYPGQSFCWGLALPSAGIPLNLSFVRKEDGQTVYQGQTVISSINATGERIVSGKTCAEAGTKQSCEMECRIDPTNNQPCIVASCFDACGLTYSIQTCTNDVPLSSFTMCDAETQAAMKKLYNMP